MIKAKYLEHPEYAFVHIPKTAGLSFKDAIRDIAIIQYFGHGVNFSNILDYKKIMIIRDPIDRFTSAFFYLKKYPNNRSKDFFQSPNELIDGLLSFDIRAFEFLKLENSNFYPTVNGKKINTDWVFHPQSDWVIDPFRVIIYEKLQEGIDKLNFDIGVDIKLNRINKSERVDFEYSSDNIDYLKLIYKKDFETYEKYNVQSD